jgi:L-ascorbate metabolism protein UlaG (beta-lactamase superfamily)
MKVTWWGHSTLTVEDAGVRVLTDPVLVDRLAHLRRRRGPTPARSATRADVVVVSHLHADHLHLPSLLRLAAGVPVLAPRGARALLDGSRSRLGDQCIEMTPGDSMRIGAMRIEAVPAAHDGRRHPWSRHQGPALGFVLEGEHTAYFAGDTDLHPAMSALAPVDLALLPVGGWGPTLGDGHLDPQRATEAVRRCRPDVVVPIHWGTLWPIGLGRVRPELFYGPGPAFARAMRDSGSETAVRVLEPGQHLRLPLPGRPDDPVTPAGPDAPGASMPGLPHE